MLPRYDFRHGRFHRVRKTRLFYSISKWDNCTTGDRRKYLIEVRETLVVELIEKLQEYLVLSFAERKFISAENRSQIL